MERGQLGPLTKGRQITGQEREQIAARLRDRYSQGASIRDLMEQTGRSYGWTYRLLRESGVVLRGRGGAHPRRRPSARNSRLSSRVVGDPDRRGDVGGQPERVAVTQPEPGARRYRNVVDVGAVE